MRISQAILASATPGELLPSQRMLAAQLECTQPAIAWHMDRLRAAGALKTRVEVVGKERRLRVVGVRA